MFLIRNCFNIHTNLIFNMLKRIRPTFKVSLIKDCICILRKSKCWWYIINSIQNFRIAWLYSSYRILNSVCCYLRYWFTLIIITKKEKSCF